MAAKPKLTPEQWASTRAAWEDDPRKSLSWLIDELGLPISAEALRLRARNEGWVKNGPAPEKRPKLGRVKSKLGKVPKSKLGNDAASLSGESSEALFVEVVELQKEERESRYKLTPKEERFVSEYLIDLNATQAAIRSGYSAKSAEQQGYQNLQKTSVRSAIAIAQEARAKRTQIDADKALMNVWAIATADARELSQVKIDCCRHCYGEGFKRQRTVGEMNRDREKFIAKGGAIDDFDEEGGIGFDPLRPPNPDCPECRGDGHARSVILDTRHLSPQAAALYAGAKKGRYGIEVLMHNKMNAMDMVWKHLGLYEKDNTQKADRFMSSQELDALYERKLLEGKAKADFVVGRAKRLNLGR